MPHAHRSVVGLRNVFFVVALAERSFAWLDFVRFRRAGYFRNWRETDMPSDG
ncbi:MAG: hypothetical protein KGI68_03230 [Alphaproteobacteria bacterium]|nr:hypothetical protein [Alphaproteobacteria bacterium]MDE2164640.1 hypothetical protein [Alphaproteobacteria bacterium]